MTYPEINLREYSFVLPTEMIPDRPLTERDKSKLLIYNQGQLSESVFDTLPKCLPANTLLVFNNSKVIPARLFFTSESGAVIEVLCLQAVSDESINANPHKQVWKCIVGNLKRWKQDKELVIHLNETDLFARIEQRNGEDINILFTWKGDFTFLDLLEKAGTIPLPPYMNRSADEEDNTRYQTVYAKVQGSVAAPTAGLHFTERLLHDIKAIGVELSNITLHVGAGTFKPIKAQTISEHKMHEEIFEVDYLLLNNLLKNQFVIPVGTTSLRTLESICILGDKVAKGDFSFTIGQWDGFETDRLSVEDSISAIILWMKQNEKTKVTVKTSIMVVPGYKFRICKGLITNFHQPDSTLILLVAAFLGENWKNVYDFALQNNFRFLSYGDSSILLP